MPICSSALDAASRACDVNDVVERAACLDTQ